MKWIGSFCKRDGVRGTVGKISEIVLTRDGVRGTVGKISEIVLT